MTRPAPPAVHIETYGCAFNASDSEVMAGLLSRAGYQLAATPEGADAVVINSCTVKDRTILDLRKRLAPHLAPSAPGPAVILAGCVPRVPHHAREFAALSRIGPDQVGDIAEVVRRTLDGEIVADTARRDIPRLALPHRRRNPAIEILPINKGCLGACSFCQTVLARGRLVSFPEEEILARIETAVAEGVRIVWLTSQDCGAYGLDRGSNLPRLLRGIAAVPGDFLVRVGMANPDLIKLFPGEFAEALAHPKFFKFAHIPLQAGSDRVLQDMNRLYTVDDFRTIVGILRRAVPDITIATDVIVGYPTESEDDFEATLGIVRDLEIPVVNRSRFSPRPGTPATRLKPLPSRTVSERSRILYDSHRAIAQDVLARCLHNDYDCIVEETVRPGIQVARTRYYQPVLIKAPDGPGTCVAVTPTAVEGFHLAA